MLKTLIDRLKKLLFRADLAPETLRQVGKDIVEGGLTRRSFSNDYFDLFIWLDDQGQLREFQLCYEKMGNEHVITWSHEGTLSHRKVDGGKQQRKMSSIFVPDGAFPRTLVCQRFAQNSSQLDPHLVAQIIEKLESYSGPQQ
ncbi:MAG TPA: hypothetical protein PKO06_08925 [Candidatus Ozemobacteraceae bacterium]|nr:hypothetical protein [Candidatus Ozemobacteraceae bacterium]